MNKPRLTAPGKPMTRNLEDVPHSSRLGSLLRDAKLAAVTPTNSGLRMIYALVDGN